MYKICVCGGGALGHVCAGVISSIGDISVNVFTRRPELWSKSLTITDINGKTISGSIDVISDNPKIALEGCDLVFLCLPGYAIQNTLETIRPFVSNAIVGSVVCSTGFFFLAHKILGSKAKLFGFQRVPYIARVTSYGHSANILGYKTYTSVYAENILDQDLFLSWIEKVFMTPVKKLNSYYEVSLTNSNPILHTGRLYTMWRDWNGDKQDHCILFYKEWTVEASLKLIAMDAEFMHLLEVLNVSHESVPSLLDYYESTDAESLTKKIIGIKAFENIMSPMIEVEGGWVPDFSSRYFTEDFPFGLKYIIDLANKEGVQCPNLTEVFEWGMSAINER